MMSALEDLAAVVTAAGVPCVATPVDPRPSGLHAFLDAPTLPSTEGTLCGDMISGAPDMRVTLHLRGAGPDAGGVRALYAALLVVLEAIPDAWWLDDDVAPRPASETDPYGYTIPLTSRRP